MKKRMTAIVAAAIIALSCMLLTACGGSGKKKTQYSDTFSGKVSEQSYASKDEAAEEFLQTEVCGETTRAEFVRYEKTGDLSKKELSDLKLDEEVTSAEWGVVVYVEDDVQTFAAKPQKNNEKSQKLVALRIGNQFKYWVPPLSEGETVTKSYYEDVVDGEKYGNCTVTGKSKIKGSVSIDMHMSGAPAGAIPSMPTIPLDTEVTQTIRMDGSMISITQKGMGQNIVMYYVRTNKGMVMVMEYDKNNYMAVPYGSDEYAAMINGAFSGVDHSFFVKTKTGFMLNEERGEEYMRVGMEAAMDGMDLEEMLESMYEQMGVDFDPSIGNFDIDIDKIDSVGFSATVTGGRINTVSTKLAGKISVDIAMSMMDTVMTVSEQIEYTDCSQTYTYSDFGTTSVSLPNAAKKAVEDAGYKIL